MSNSKSLYKHDDEEKIAIYCAQNNVEFNIANAYDVVMDTFKSNPIIIEYTDKKTEEQREWDITQRVARQIEFQPKTIERIAAKAEVYKQRFVNESYENNIQKAKANSKPDLQKLVDNLYRLNIVDEHSYLAIVNNFMQIKYSRDNEIPEDDKTCLFFNGVAHNGKSATAKAICEVEAQYGKVFKAQSGKLLSSTHEEQVWKSHLNYFDEVKPTDIDRELLLTIVNGGNVELNPKNKKPYNYHVNTNNIFTSNDQINLMQRRVSIIKFGNRLNGRPLGAGTLKEIITNIMDSLPDFDRYYDMFHIVSVYNENRINPLAMGDITTFLNSKFNRVNETDEYTLTAELIFAPHEIDGCIQDKYNKQIISSERRDAVKIVLKYLAEKGLIHEVNYKNCTTKYYKVTGAEYIKIITEFGKINTKDEKNIKVTKVGLYDTLAPFFSDKPNLRGLNANNVEQNTLSESATEAIYNNKASKKINEEKQTQEIIRINASDLNDITTSLVNFVDDAVYCNITGPTKNQILVTRDTKAKGTMLFYRLLKQMTNMLRQADVNNVPFDIGITIEDALKNCITPELCQCISYKGLLLILKETIDDFDDSYDNFVKELYMHLLGIKDEKTLENFEKYKLSYLPECRPEGVTIKPRAYFDFCKKRKEQKEQKEQQILARKEQRKLKKELEKQQRLAKYASSENSTDKPTEQQNT